MISFERLQVYQEAILLSLNIYKITKSFPKEETFGLIGQLRRAAVSIPLNIAEGSSRSKKDFRHFLDMARGSCYELVHLLKISLELGFINKSIYDKTYTDVESLVKRISALKRSLV